MKSIPCVFTLCIVASFLLLPPDVPAASSCYPDLPPPQLIVTGTEAYDVNGQAGMRVLLGVTNSADFPDALFQSAPHLPPCGLNTNASRSWVEIFDEYDTYVYGFCALSSLPAQGLWFAVPRGQEPPASVYITVTDRQCGLTYTSNVISTSSGLPDLLPDLVISSMAVTSFTSESISYRYTITNIGQGSANLDGPTDANFDNVSVQAFLSADPIFNNDDDRPAGGTILGVSPLGELASGESVSGSFSASASVDFASTPYLTLMVDWGDVVDEANETNNTAAVRICVTTDPDAVNWPAWTPSTVYNSGDTVSHNQLVWQAKWWTQNNEPSRTAEPWLLLSPVELDWEANAAYTGGSLTNYAGRQWQAKWWTLGDEPGTADVWQDIGPASCQSVGYDPDPIVQAGPEANVLFVVDDSGSMDWEVLTRDVDNNGLFTATQPDGTSPVGSGNVTHRDSNDDGIADCHFGRNGQTFFGYTYIVEFSENTYADNGLDCNTADDRAWRIRNSDFNPLYFNPTRTYAPWPGVNQLGDPFQDMPVTAALANPYDPDSEAINLLVHNSNWLGGLNRGTSDRDNDGTPDGFFFYTWDDIDGDGLFDDGEETEHQLSNLDPAYLASLGQTAEQVQQNFANWFSYYRSRELATKAAYGTVIAAAIHVRMGLSTLHNNHQVNTPLRSMNADATTGNKRLLLDALYSMHAMNGTPLRQSLLQAGRYLECATNSLFSECPVLSRAEGGESQQHFIVMMTDGTYNGLSPNVGNTDGDFDSYWDGGAYADTYTDTLADVAMHFYERDLHPNLDDRVPTIPGVDEATHQHVVTYTLTLGLEGSLSSNPLTPEDAFNWPNPATSPIARIDDLRHAAYNGRGQFYSAPEPEAFLAALENVMQSIVSRIDQPLEE